MYPADAGKNLNKPPGDPESRFYVPPVSASLSSSQTNTVQSVDPRSHRSMSSEPSPYAAYSPRSPVNPSTSNGFVQGAYANDFSQYRPQPPPQQSNASQFYQPSQPSQPSPYQSAHSSSSAQGLDHSQSHSYNIPSLSLSSTAMIPPAPPPAPVPVPMPNPPSPHMSRMTASGSRETTSSYQSSFYNVEQNQYQDQYQVPHQPAVPQVSQAQQQVPMQQANAQPVPQAVPFMMAGLQQMANVAQGGRMDAAFGAQLFQTLAPGAAGMTDQFIGQGQEKMKSFMRMPKYYFAVNHRYVIRKLSLILMPFTNRTWGRQRAMDPGGFEGMGGAGTPASSYLPPKDDVNAPDLYIPVMSFLTYVLVVGFVFGMRNAFKAEVLAKYFSKGLGVLSMEVLIIKLGLYLINARPTPWLDVIAYRGYKFVGVVLTIVLGLIVPKMYVPALLYSATAMGIFLMRSHRRIILPRDMEAHQAHDLARRNAFLLFLSVLQYPIYWLLARVLDVRA